MVLGSVISLGSKLPAIVVAGLGRFVRVFVLTVCLFEAGLFWEVGCTLRVLIVLRGRYGFGECD